MLTLSWAPKICQCCGTHLSSGGSNLTKQKKEGLRHKYIHDPTDYSSTNQYASRMVKRLHIILLRTIESHDVPPIDGQRHKYLCTCEKLHNNKNNAGWDEQTSKTALVGVLD